MQQLSRARCSRTSSARKLNGLFSRRCNSSGEVTSSRGAAAQLAREVRRGDQQSWCRSAACQRSPLPFSRVRVGCSRTSSARKQCFG
uniref:Uncharacterized protein n=1 Tax=Oryza sativa subsp. japonica TaxID=39947 RepID=Q10LH2_ORYSJ|nr:hypothetical protein LOC_Os03g22760 [Oryza sativa Japonica Group]